MNKKLYHKLKKCSGILKNKNLYSIINDIIEENEILEYHFENQIGTIKIQNSTTEKMQFEILNEQLIFTKYFGETKIEKIIINPYNYHIQSILLEKRPSGIILEKVEKTYGETLEGKSEIILKELNSVRYTFQNSKILTIFPKLDIENSSIQNIFNKLIGTNEKILFLGTQVDFIGIEPEVACYFTASIQPHYYIQRKKTVDTSYTPCIYLNMEDVSDLFDVIEGKDKLLRIYDLYKGFINKRNIKDLEDIHYGILPEESFDLKTGIGITDQEDQIVGKSITPKSKQELEYLQNILREYFYNTCDDLDSREALLNCIKYKFSNNQIEKPESERKQNQKKAYKKLFYKKNCDRK